MFWFDPYTNGAAHVSLLQLIVTMLISFTLLPSPDVRGWGETHSLDGPCWSLLQEYIANIFYAFFSRKITKTILWVIVSFSGIALILTACRRGDLGTGWGYQTFWIAFVRMMFPFFAGLLLYRTGRLLYVPMAYIICSLMLVVLFCMPTFSTRTANGLYESACIIVAFPFIVATGAGGEIQGRWAKICKFSGDISYPVYITHYPFIYIYTMWIYNEKPPASKVIPFACGLFVFFILLAYAAFKLYDEPVRAWLKKKVLLKR